MEINIPDIILARAIVFTLSCNFGAGGHPVAGNLSLKGIRRTDSPAFALVIERCRTSAASSKCFEDLLLELNQIFRDGKATPSELDEGGRTLSHV